jgi:FKBP-type peptidyl-prolyl cis-trans isomerase FkpA
MRKISSVLLLAVILLAACKSDNFKKGTDNLEYKIISEGNGANIKYGNFMQLHYSTYYSNGKKDSLLNSSRDAGVPVIEMLDSVATPLAYYNILTQVKKGDSLVIRILVDSVFKRSPAQMPPFMKKGHYLVTTLKIYDIFTTKEQADSARDAERRLSEKRDSVSAIAQLAKDDKELQAYFAKNNIKAQKGTEGTYVEIIQPGTGPNIDTNVIAKTNYTGRTMDGKIFDSNTDPSKGHVEPYNVNMTSDPAYGSFVIKGWKDGLQLLNKGAKAKFYIPSPLAYGKHGAGGDIAPNSILIFDIEVVDILNKEQALAAVEEQKKKMQDMQKKYMDSLSKLKPDTTRRK